jgi:outer membrane protein
MNPRYYKKSHVRARLTTLSLLTALTTNLQPAYSEQHSTDANAAARGNQSRIQSTRTNRISQATASSNAGGLDTKGKAAPEALSAPAIPDVNAAPSRLTPDTTEAPLDAAAAGDSDHLQLRGLENPVPLAEQMELPPPNLKALITITNRLDPLALDATSSRKVSLQDVLKQAIDHNLDIGIRDTDAKSKKWSLLSSYGQFLPNINLGYRYQFLKGTLNLPFGGADNIRLNSPFIIANAGYTYYAFRGGKILFTALQNRNYLRAARHQTKASINDVLLETTRRYYKLLLSEAQLRIRIKAVQTSEDQLDLDQNLLEGGLATMLDVLQAKTQLASDRQALIDQQIARRNAAIDLAEYLNADQSVDLLTEDKYLQRNTLVADNFPANMLVSTAIVNRPELKQYEELRLAAKKAINIAAAPLMPTFQTYGNVYGIGETLSNSTKISLNPITLSGSGIGQTTQVAGIPHRVSRQIKPLYTIGYQAQWNFTGLGTADLANTVAAKRQAREALLQSNQELNVVTRQVRQSYLNSLSTGRKIEETIARVNSSIEELRLAQLRFQYGVGKNIDVVKAQQDYTSALIDNSEALVNYNVAQSQLLHDLGIISTANLTSRTPLSTLSP